MARPIRRNYDIAGAFIMLSGMLYIPLFLLEGWDVRTKSFLFLGVILLAIGLLLRGRRRWLAYVAYVLILISMLVTLIGMGTSSIGAWWWVIIMILQVLGVYHLFRLLWAPKTEFEK